METEERKTPFNRLKDIKNRYSTEEIVCGRVLREFEEKTDKEIKQIENKKETLKPQEKNNSKAMFSEETLIELGIEHKESAEIGER